MYRSFKAICIRVGNEIKSRKKKLSDHQRDNIDQGFLLHIL